ncbi:unnamed protein product [Penicillium salamii]|uniref:G-protein coupled receptors family 2 profile 2 domain-containing protein n=1 Tax=Penicillium salamii TaxID=1612424 RepID=A0A9W4IFG6_9EURO|nr:unnamed protein product [Penicillium salamii]CAG7948250.1 unnamed protein product [Penicillium salamii]CAG7948581.1 unnamed protein product [Penicillium salamii]CAG7948980.1 unnamed protein product [Penicillium salamii]CAG7958179.1 unnamed protein product [Penicillium salamii]
MAPAPSQRQLAAISVTERVCSSISLIGTFIIITSFIGSRSFRKPINRLVFYASWGNMMANIATMISQSGIHAGARSPLCQVQAFLIQWFMPADALWAFAMACNVYLTFCRTEGCIRQSDTFFHKYNSEQLRQIEWKYVVCCYGFPFIPSFIYFFIYTQARGWVYGTAILWCWVALPWDYLRIAVFYGPVWFVIFLTFAIYLRAGSVIYKKHRELRNLSGIESLGSDTQPDGPLVTHAGIQITSEIACFVPVHRSLSARDVPTRSFTASSFTPCSIPPEGGPIDSFSMLQNLEESSSPIQDSCRPWPDPSPLRAEVSAKAARHECGDSYTQRRKAIEASCAAWAYTKYAMLFFIALLVTWVPSTVNRVYAFARPDDYSFGLFYASSFVLPLQGFWNSLIYVSISWPAFKTLWRDLRSRSTGLRNI